MLTISDILLWMYPDISKATIFGVRLPKSTLILYNIWFEYAINVPRYFKSYDFWGTFATIYVNFVQHMIWICNKCTPTFKKACFLRYIRQFTLLIARILLLNITKTGACHIKARSCFVIYYDLNVKSLNTNHMYCNLIYTFILQLLFW